MHLAPTHRTPRRVHRPWRLIFLAAAATLVLPSCTLRQSDNDKVTTGNGVYLHLFGNPSWMVSSDLYRGLCKRSIVCTADFLQKHVEVRGWGAAEFHDGIRKYSSFRSAIDSALSGGYATGWGSGAKCLVLRKSTSGNLTWSTEWIQPIRYTDDCWTGTRTL